jgi:DNA transformation protein
MAERPEFLEMVLDQLEPLGRVSARRMFGGFGLYCEGDFFALVDDDALYLKADDATRPDFEDWSPGRFTYRRMGKEQSLSYYEVPLDALEDGDELCEWARKAIEAMRRSKALAKARESKRS